ncbi:helix-turn-helix domain-containing protein [Aureibacillus halotolerans]|uniref:Helix-turn-helix protein n=1 Tax=Aureibacillus halotolerans TaxID=1508390 RepID=A0A4R6U740_9BACI|nr:helix-turn-helix domain-containing protein [Aureibacillus halotolerans]TDQ40365.1 helix-turn-helix protein [Aureibacillus halotolerans]
MHRKWFYRLILSYLPMFCIVISILIVISFLFIYQLTKNEAVKVNQIYAEHVMETIEYYLRLTDHMVMKEIQGTDTFSSFFNETFDEETERPWVNYQTNLKLDQLERTLPLFSTIYLYRHKDQAILNPSYGFTTVQSFWDGAFIGQLLNSEETPTDWSSVRTITVGNQNEEVTTLVRSVSLLTGNQGFVVINVHTDALRRLIATSTDSQLTYLRLIDQRGHDVFFLGEPAAKDSSHEAITKLSNGRSSYTGWTIMSGLQEKQWFDIFSLFSYVWFAVALVSVLLGVVWIILMSHRNNKPIQSIMESINSYSKQRNRPFLRDPSGDELGIINTAIQSLLRESSEMDQQNKENLMYKQRMLFQEWLEGNRVISFDEWADERELSSDFQLNEACLLLFEIDHYEQFFDNHSKKDLALVNYVVKKVLEEMVDGDAAFSIWHEWVSDRRLAAVVLCSRETDLGWHQLAERYQNWIHSEMQFTITIALGSVKHDMDCIPLAYSEAKRALSHKITLGRQRIIAHEDIAGLNQIDSTHYIPLVEEIIQRFKQGEGNWQGGLGQLFHLFRKDQVSMQFLTSILSYFTYQMQQEMNSLAYDYVEVWNSGSSLLSDMETNRFENLDDISNYVLDWLTNKEIDLQHIRNKNIHRQSILDIKKYIEKHYHCIDLSLSYLSDLFNIQPTYLSRIFKEEMGEKFVDYLMNVRIRQAKTLLSETEETVQQITVKVGYTHVVSFTRAFKKITGVPPGEYRKAVQNVNQ